MLAVENKSRWSDGGKCRQRRRRCLDNRCRDGVGRAPTATRKQVEDRLTLLDNVFGVRPGARGAETAFKTSAAALVAHSTSQTGGRARNGSLSRADSAGRLLLRRDGSETPLVGWSALEQSEMDRSLRRGGSFRLGDPSGRIRRPRTAAMYAERHTAERRKGGDTLRSRTRKADLRVELATHDVAKWRSGLQGDRGEEGETVDWVPHSVGEDRTEEPDPARRIRGTLTAAAIVARSSYSSRAGSVFCEDPHEGQPSPNKETARSTSFSPPTSPRKSLSSPLSVLAFASQFHTKMMGRVRKGSQPATPARPDRRVSRKLKGAAALMAQRMHAASIGVDKTRPGSAELGAAGALGGTAATFGELFADVDHRRRLRIAGVDVPTPEVRCIETDRNVTQSARRQRPRRRSRQRRRSSLASVCGELVMPASPKLGRRDSIASSNRDDRDRQRDSYDSAVGSTSVSVHSSPPQHGLQGRRVRVPRDNNNLSASFGSAGDSPRAAALTTPGLMRSASFAASAGTQVASPIAVQRAESSVVASQIARRVQLFKCPNPAPAATHRRRSRVKHRAGPAVAWAARVFDGGVPGAKPVVRASPEPEADVGSRRRRKRAEGWDGEEPPSLSAFREERLRERRERPSFYTLQLAVSHALGALPQNQKFRATLSEAPSRRQQKQSSIISESDSSEESNRVVLRDLSVDPETGLLVVDPTATGDDRTRLRCADVLSWANSSGGLFGRSVRVEVAAEPPAATPRPAALPRMTLTALADTTSPGSSRSLRAETVGSSSSDEPRTITEVDVTFDDPCRPSVRAVRRRRSSGGASVSSIASLQIAVRAINRWRPGRSSVASVEFSDAGPDVVPEAARRITPPPGEPGAKRSQSFQVAGTFRTCSFVMS